MIIAKFMNDRDFSTSEMDIIFCIEQLEAQNLYLTEQVKELEAKIEKQYNQFMEVISKI